MDLTLLGHSETRSELESVLNGVSPQVNVFDGLSLPISNAPKLASFPVCTCEILREPPRSIHFLRHVATAFLKCSVKFHIDLLNRLGGGFADVGLDRAMVWTRRFPRSQVSALAWFRTEIGCRVFKRFRFEAMSSLKQICKFSTFAKRALKKVGVCACSRVPRLSGSSSSAVTVSTYELQSLCLCAS